MFYHHAIMELEAEARTRELRSSAGGPAIGGLLPRFLRGCYRVAGHAMTGHHSPRPVA